MYKTQVSNTCCSKRQLKPGPLNPWLATNKLPATQSYVAHGDI